MLDQTSGLKRLVIVPDDTDDICCPHMHPCEGCGEPTSSQPEMHREMPYYFCGPACKANRYILD